MTWTHSLTKTMMKKSCDCQRYLVEEMHAALLNPVARPQRESVIVLVEYTTESDTRSRLGGMWVERQTHLSGGVSLKTWADEHDWVQDHCSCLYRTDSD